MMSFSNRFFYHFMPLITFLNLFLQFFGAVGGALRKLCLQGREVLQISLIPCPGTMQPQGEAYEAT